MQNTKRRSLSVLAGGLLLLAGGCQKVGITRVTASGTDSDGPSAAVQIQRQGPIVPEKVAPVYPAHSSYQGAGAGND